MCLQRRLQGRTEILQWSIFKQADLGIRSSPEAVQDSGYFLAWAIS